MDNREMQVGSGAAPLTVAVYTSDRWEHVCPVVRIAGPAEVSNVGILKGSYWEDGRFCSHPDAISDADVVLIQRDFPSHVDLYQEIITQARAQEKLVVYEIDDLLPELPAEHPDFYHYLTARTDIIRAMVEADAVVGSTPALCDYVSSFNPNVWLFPNYLNDQLWTIKQPSEFDHPPLVIGYMGGHSHASDLEMVIPSLERILKRYGKDIQLRFWGTNPPGDLLDWHNVEWLDPGLVDYREFALYFTGQECDIFLAPLRENLFNQCKSHLKFLEYSALGIPGVYSNITPYMNIVKHGENGFLASSLDEWEEYLGQLIEDQDLRYHMGLNALSTVRSSWLLSQHTGEWSKIFQDIRTTARLNQDRTHALNLAQKLQDWQGELEDQLSEQGKLSKKISEQLYASRLQIDALKSLVDQKEETSQYFKDLYLEILNSNSWKLLQWAFKFRLKVLPYGSLRGRTLKLLVYTLRILKNEGLLAFGCSLGRVGVAMLGGKVDSLIGPADVGDRKKLTAHVVPGIRTHSPIVSLIIIRDAFMEGPSEHEVCAWVEDQTFPSAQVVVWDKAAGMAFEAREPSSSWQVSGARSLCAGLRGRYLAIASHDLLQQNRSYLEYNIIALETEGLAFTVNLHSNSGWALARLRQGFLPGSRAEPLLRQVVSKGLVGDDLAIDFSSSLDDGSSTPQVVGKVILHTTEVREVGQALPFDSRMPVGERKLLRNNILMRMDPGVPWEYALQMLHPIESILSLAPEPSNLPTVILIQTYLAVGGAEQIALKIMQNLNGRLRFVVVAYEELDSELGTTADAFREVTPYVYTVPDFLNSALNYSFTKYLIDRFQPCTLYIANGTTWIYDALNDVRKQYPDLRIVNQVYDHEVGWINRYDLSSIMNIDGHIGVNSKICQAYVNEGVKQEQIYLIENGIDPAELNPDDYSVLDLKIIKGRLGLPLNQSIVTFASRIHPQKRPMDFVELARRFALDPSIAFLMVGDGPLAGKVDEQVAKIGLKNFHRHKFYRPISDILAISDVVVLPSDFEGMPMVIIEAQAMGKPVVVTDVGNNREILDYTNGGVVIPRIGDVAALMEGVSAMLEKPPDPAQLRIDTLSRFDIAVVAQKYFEAFIGSKHA
jgi:glycosyltransferase involved in cell wall biosynthesis